MSDLNKGCLTNKQKVDLAAAVGGKNMDLIALGHLDMEQPTIDNIREENIRSMVNGNVALIDYWARKNGGEDQVKRLAGHLYDSLPLIDCRKIHDILGVTQEELQTSASGGASGNAATSNNATPESERS